MQPQSCAKCKDCPEDILMLSCSHDLCLDCASRRYQVQIRKNYNSNLIICQICRSQTQLDRGSANQLLKLMKSKQFHQTPKQTSQLAMSHSKLHNQVSDTILNATSVPQGFRQIRKSCKQHVDQQVSYFCFTCQTECVCSQCIIHGEHKNHQVKTIKKSVPLVRGKLDSIKMEIQNAVGSLVSLKQNHQKNIKNWADSIDKHKRNVATAFQEFRLRIDAKQKQILSKFDKALQIATEDFGLCIKSVNHTIQELKHGTKYISQIGSKDQVQLLNFYAMKKGQLEKMKVKEGPREPSQVTKRKLDSNKVVISLANILTKLGQLDLQSELKSQILMIQDNL